MSRAQLTFEQVVEIKVADDKVVLDRGWKFSGRRVGVVVCRDWWLTKCGRRRPTLLAAMTNERSAQQRTVISMIQLLISSRNDPE